ncbi:hypothetical protein [Streptomyces sp. NPDC093591]|uniref:hypothetical protein n=1 Tax=Streptomyces sp. NPDC093591 TaxID=3366044 RepID=UPI003809DA98
MRLRPAPSGRCSIWRSTLGRRAPRLDRHHRRRPYDAQGTVGAPQLLYGRITVDPLKVDGDRRLFDLLQAWEPEEQEVTTRHVRLRPAGRAELGPACRTRA